MSVIPLRVDLPADMMAELGPSDAPAQEDPDSVSKSSSIHHSVQNVPFSNRRSFAIPYPAKYGSESVSICLNKSAARSFGEFCESIRKATDEFLPIA